MPDFKYKPTPLMLPTSRYDVRRADFAVNFISMLKHTTGEWYGKPFQLMPWQEQIIRDIFGIVGEDGYRQFRTAYVEVGKKNGKSELAAAIALYLLFADGEAGVASATTARPVPVARMRRERASPSSTISARPSRISGCTVRHARARPGPTQRRKAGLA